MTLIDDISKYGSVAIVGLAKNAGKTECLNYIIRHFPRRCGSLAVTSIGVDGEGTDVVTQTPKPEITLKAGMIFATTETHYRDRKLISEIMEIGTEHTALGRVVTARTHISGKILLSGPSDTVSLRRLIVRFRELGATTTLVDGALSRLSLSSPAVTDALVLATGAAVANSVQSVAKRTRFVYEMISLPKADYLICRRLQNFDRGVWGVDSRGDIIDLGIPSVLQLDKYKDRIFEYGDTIYVAGAVTDRLLSFLRQQKRSVRLIMRDFTRMFAEPATVGAYLKSGNDLQLLMQNRLLAICVNPYAPRGRSMDSNELIHAIASGVQVPVYDIKTGVGLNCLR